MRSFYYLLLIILFSFPLLMRESFAAEQKKEVVKFLSLSDIHFDPFIACYQTKQFPCPLIVRLQTAPVSQWHSILAAYDQVLPQYRQDSNSVLLFSTLSAAQKISHDEAIQFVIVLGDMLGHSYRHYYKKYSLDLSRAHYQVFVKKTIAFLTSEFARTFPLLDVYMAVGNNDSYQKDYMADPQSLFFKETGQSWSSLIREKNQENMQRVFQQGGYYAIDPFENLRLIVLNTVLFSSKAKGNKIAKAAAQELDWLHGELVSAKNRHQKVMLAMHIPAGMDIYATLQFRLFRLIEFWDAFYTKRFEEELKTFSPEIVGIFAGHLHADWFQILTLSNKNRIPMTGTPAISPLFGNNPGFKIYTYSKSSQKLTDFITYSYSISGERRFKKEYDFNGMAYQSTHYTCENKKDDRSKIGSLCHL